VTKEVWDLFNQWKLDGYLIIKQNTKILDLGCGPGNFLFHLYHQPNPPNYQYTGVEKKTINELESSIGLFYDYHSKIDVHGLIDNQNKIPLYEYYSEVVKAIIAINEPLSKEKFKIEIENNIQYGRDIVDFLWDNSIQSNSYHLIVLSKVFHYGLSKSPKEVINKCFNLIIKNGYIAITLKKDCSSTKRIEYNINELMAWTKNFTEIDSKVSSDITYYLGRKE